MILLFVTIPNIASARNWVTKLIMDSNPKYVSYYFQNNETNVSDLESNNTGLFPEGTYYPAYLPRDMKLIQFIYKESTMTYRFQDTEENNLMIQVSGQVRQQTLITKILKSRAPSLSTECKPATEARQE